MRLTLHTCVVLLLLAFAAQAAEKLQTVAELRALADAANGEHCAHICVEAAKAVAEESNQLFTEGKVEQAQTTMKDAARYAQRAAAASVQSRKKQKQTEIALRKLEKRILDIMETLNFEDKPPVLEAANEIEKSRVSILTAMFDLDKDKK